MKDIDPDETLRLALSIVHNGRRQEFITGQDAMELATLINDLDVYLGEGQRLPDRWRKAYRDDFGSRAPKTADGFDHPALACNCLDFGGVVGTNPQCAVHGSVIPSAPRHAMPVEPVLCDGSGTPGASGSVVSVGTSYRVRCDQCNGRFPSTTGFVPDHPESKAWPNGMAKREMS